MTDAPTIQESEPSISSLVDQGLAYHQQGDLQQAEQVYLSILKREPQHADALHLLGLLKGRLGLNAEAIRLIEQAIAFKPRISNYRNNLGNLQAKIGDKKGAEESYRQAIELDPRNADAYLNLGKLLDHLHLHAQAKDYVRSALNLDPCYVEAHMSMGRLEEAASNMQAAFESYRNAIRLQPELASGHLAMGNAYSRLGDLDEAEHSYKTALAIDPLFADGYFNLARLIAPQGRLREAVVLYQQSIALAHNDCADAYNNLGALLSELRLHQDALAAYKQAIELRPDFDDAIFNLGKELTLFGDEECGLQWLHKAVQLNASNASAYLELGATALKRGMLEEAVRFCRASLERDPHSRGARRNLAIALSYQGNPEGLRMLEVLVREQPLDANDHWTWAEHLLLHGNGALGWKEYEWRMHADELRSQHPELNKPRWWGEPLEGKTILLYAEQGQGDTLQFSRFAGLVAERGGKVVLQVQPSLKSLLKDAPGVSQCVSQGETIPEFSTYAPLMSLPYILKLNVGSIPPVSLTLPAGLAIPALGSNNRLRVGIAWAGNSKHPRDRLRSTKLSQWAELASIDGVDFISLQAGDTASQAGDTSNQFRFLATCDTVADFADTAALIAQLDLVITVDTAVAHLAGSLGKPVWILPYSCGDWRWGLERTDTEWYPTARLFRQSSAPDWANVFSEVAMSLRQLLANNSST